ncbi:MAG: hypothetical protein R3E83_03050 [Burkholderiaceae bacterium]
MLICATWIRWHLSRFVVGQNTCALADKLARICFGVLRDHTPFGEPATRLTKKMNRQAFELAH